MLTGEIIIIITAVVAGVISGVTGTGSSLLLLPLLVQAYGPKPAIQVMALAAVIGNLSRFFVWWRQVDWKVTLVYSVTGVPCAAIGAYLLLIFQSTFIDLLLGVFFLCVVPLKRLMDHFEYKISLPQVGLCGGIIGILTGIVMSTGPLSVPVFVSYGLRKGAFLGSEAASALLLYSSKITTFAAQGSLPMTIVIKGVLLGLGISVGTVMSKHLVFRLSEKVSTLLIDIILFISGSFFIIKSI